jgi:hypothetical protein
MCSKGLQHQLYYFLEHFMTCSTKFPGAVPNRAFEWSYSIVKQCYCQSRLRVMYFKIQLCLELLSKMLLYTHQAQSGEGYFL